MWEEGVLLDDQWVPLAVLQRLNTVHPYLGPGRSQGQHLDGALAKLLTLHGLARAATRTGYVSGARLRAFLQALERTPQPELPGTDHDRTDRTEN